MDRLSLRQLRLRSGEQYRSTERVGLQPFRLGGVDYLPTKDAEVRLEVTKTTSGILLELSFESVLWGPCYRCLKDARVEVAARGREYQAESPTSDDERSDYVQEGFLEVAVWARDLVGLALPDQILCRLDCAGLCGECGEDLNARPHAHGAEQADPRWAALAGLRAELEEPSGARR